MEEQTHPPSSKISTVVPGTPHGDENAVRHLSHVDLLLKLHYIRAVYFFSDHAAHSLSIAHLKKPMFPLLDRFTQISGRIRLADSGRPFIKCNDAGVRIVESHRDDVTVEEWLERKGYSCVEELVHEDHALGPDLGFSPLVFVKFTWFKCGGLCVGLSWSHVLGDAFSAFNFITKWTQILEGNTITPPEKSLPVKHHKPQRNSLSVCPKSAKKAKTVEELWLVANDTKMVTHTFHVTSEQLNRLATTTFFGANETATTNNSAFEILSALVWKYIARIRGSSEPKVVTICAYEGREIDDAPSNSLVLSVVEVNVVVAKSDLADLAKAIAEEKKVENVEKWLEESEGTEDFVVYGANLTFVDLENAKIYEAELNGEKPVVANCSIHSVGDQGVVLVLPSPEDDEGRIVTVSLPENEIKQLSDKMDEEWGISSHPY